MSITTPAWAGDDSKKNVATDVVIDLFMFFSFVCKPTAQMADYDTTNDIESLALVSKVSPPIA
jgi:hypothetical protein